jgi:serine/threonine-protein kinase
LAALPTPDPRPDAHPGASDEGLRLLRELGDQAVPAWAALDSRAEGRARLVVVERAARASFEDGEIADWIGDARRLSTLEHPNVIRVHDVVIRSGDVLVVSDFLDGVRWSELAATATLDTALRVIADALAGLSAIHNLRDPADPKRQLFKLVHGALTPDCIIVGLDGVARIIAASRPKSATARLAETRSAYLAPEVLLEDDSADARADVYSVGVMLWEALSQRRFLPNLPPSAIVTQLLSGRIPAVTVPEASPWAAPLADVVMRALSADPEKRFPSAAAMSAELRRIGGVKLPLAVRVAGGVRATFAEVAKKRRAELERGEVRPSDVSLRATRPPEELSVDVTEFTEPSQTASTVPPPMSREPSVGARPSPAIAIPPLDASPKPGVLATPPKPPSTLPPPNAPPKPVALATPPKPPSTLPPPNAPPKPVALAAPPTPPPASRAPITTGPSQRHAAVLPLEAHAPPPPDPSEAALEPDPVTTAGPFAMATQPELTPQEVTFLPPKRMLRILVAGGAVLVIGGATWWIASRGSASPPAGDRGTPSAVARPTAAPGHGSVTETPNATAPGEPANRTGSAAEDSPGTPSQAAAAPNALGPGASPSGVRTATPIPVLQHPFPPTPPTGPGPAKPKHSPGHRGYEPEGI